MKDFIVKENDAFRLRVKGWKCNAPNDLNSIEFVQEILNNGEIQMTSTYNYFLTDKELEVLAKGLLTFREEGSIVNA